MSKINSSIFRQYDIRGRENEEELNTRTMELLGKAAGTYLARKNITTCVVGRDARATSETFSEAAIRGLRSAGIAVIDIGMVLTPMMYWAQYHLESKGGFMITASHNPKGWNGVKIAADFSTTLAGEELQKLRTMIENDDLKEAHREGEVEHRDIREAYFADLVERVHLEKTFHVVVNTGNGTAGPFAGELMRRTGCEVTEHLADIDATYPNYTPNPAELDMMEDTARVVKEQNADLGLAFDGDGDRLGLVDEKGNTIWPDQYMIFLARLVLEEEPGATIIFDVKSSRALEEDVAAHGGKPVMVKTGHSIAKQKMKEKEVKLGGELSGHMYIKHRFYGHDDALFAALLLLEYFSKRKKAVSKLAAELPHYISTPGYNAATPDDKKYDVIQEITEEFQSEGYEVIDIDGARVNFDGSAGSPQGWGLVRASNTSPNLTLRFEAKTQEDLDQIQAVFKEKLGKYDFVSKEWIPG